MNSSANCCRPTCSSPGSSSPWLRLRSSTGRSHCCSSSTPGGRLGLLLTGAGIFGWLTITSMLFVVYAPRGPRPADIEGLNAFEIRIIPLAYLVVSLAIFIGFLVALKQYEDLQEGAS